MTSSPYQTVIVPVNLGEASRFNRAIFPLLYRKRDTLGRGDLYLDATLDEMLKITNIGTSPQQWKELVATTKARYDQLMLQKAELEQRPRSNWNLLKKFANYRAARIFLAATKSFYFATKSRSEEVMRSVGRSLLSVPGEDVEAVDNDLPPDADIEGIAVRLDRPLDDTTMQQIVDAANTFASYSGLHQDDQMISQTSTFLSDEYVLASESLTSLSSGVTEEATEETPDITNLLRLSSPTIISNYYTNNFYGSIYSPHSNMDGTTVQIGGSQNSGSVIHTDNHTS